MKHTLAIAQRELVEKSFIFTAAFALAAIIFLIPLFPRVPAQEWRGIYVIASGIVAVAFALGVGAILGATMIGREMSDRRLSFYFTKPVGASAIWFGKVIASALLVCGTFAISMLPTLFAGRKATLGMWSGEGSGLIGRLAILAAALFFLAHVLSTIARARSAWAFVDLAAIGLLGLFGWWIAQPLLSRRALEMLTVVGEIFGWLALVAVIAAGAYQLAMGRTERQQSHLALARFLWPALAVAIAICGGVVWWVVTATPADLTDQIHARVAPHGSYALVAGKAAHRRDYIAMFLLNTHNGTYERLDAPPLRGGFSADGKKLLMLRSINPSSTVGELVVRDVAPNSPETATGLYLGQGDWPINISSDASRVAYVTSGVLTVFDVAQKRSLGSVRLQFADIQSMWFQTPDVIRILAATPPNRGQTIARTLHIYEYNLRQRAVQQTGEFTKTDRYLVAYANVDGSRLFVRDADGRGTTVLDGRSGAELLRLPAHVAPLADGRMYSLNAPTIAVMSPAGALERVINIGVPADTVWFARPISSSQILIASAPKTGTSTRDGIVELVDLNTGRVTRREQGLAPRFMDVPFDDARRTIASPDQLFTDANGNLLHWNPITNEKNVLMHVKS